MKPIEFLLWTFMVTFAITSMVALLGITGILKLEPQFRRGLFYALLLEVVGCCVLLFRSEMLGGWECKQRQEWVGLDLNTGQLFQPEMYKELGGMVSDVDTLGALVPNALRRLENHNYKLHRHRDEYKVTNPHNGHVLGTVHAHELWTDHGLYSGFVGLDTSHNVRRDDHELIRFDKRSNGWTSDDEMRSWPINIYVTTNSHGQVIYEVSDKRGTSLYNSKEAEREERSPLNLGSRPMHFFDFDNQIVLLTIMRACNDAVECGEDRYITFGAVRLHKSIST